MQLRTVDTSSKRSLSTTLLQWTGAIAIITPLLTLSHSATAADTVETWDVGATDVDFYLGFEGVGAAQRAEQSIYGDIMLGYGLLPGMSAYFGTTLVGDGYAMNAEAAPYLGIFATPLDTAHVDLDLFLDVAKNGDALRIGPSFELNLDAASDMSSVGLYNRTGIPFGGLRGPATDIHGQHPAMSYYVESTTGAYASLAPSHQLLVEFNLALHPNPADTERRFDVGGFALGYNIALSDRIELIEEVFCDVPQDQERWTFSAMSGFIVTLPSVHAQPPERPSRR